jgi:hypothetical protein
MSWCVSVAVEPAVDIDYVLTGDPTDRNGRVGDGERRIGGSRVARERYQATVWRRFRTAPDHFRSDANGLHEQPDADPFRVTLTPTVPAVYMVVDLTKAAGQEGLVEYIYPETGGW